jgi:hypothetical protein
MPPADVQFLLADMNGDRRADVIEGFAGNSNYQVCLAGDPTWNCDSMATDLYDSYSWTQTILPGQLGGDARTDLIRAYEGWASYPTDINALR